MSFIGKAISKLTGADDAIKANKRARAELVTGRENAVGAINPAYDTAESYLKPYAGTGGYQGLVDLTTGSGYDVTQTPGFQSRLDELTKNINRNLSARGRSNSTFGVNALNREQSNLIGEEYQNQFNRLGALANFESSAANNLANLATGRGTSLANIYTGNAAALAGNLGQKAELKQTFSPLNQATSIFKAGTDIAKPFIPGSSLLG